MGTKTVDGAGTGTEAKNDETEIDQARNGEETVDATKAAERTKSTEAADEVTETEAVAAAGEELGEVAENAPEGASGVGQGAAAVVSAALGLVSLTGGWIGTVAAARATLVGQLKTASTASVGAQIKAVYGDAWHTTALWAGLFALASLVTGVVVLARPAFGTPGKPQAPWIKSVAWAGVSLGVIGLLLAVLKYSDALLALPSPH
ncbi:hypothetical protein [Streptomyces sp. NPDC046805]|uniref:hypothetical protein n=1 Tax=Streptomyces sp. NPDC046805 TaxID=3155134 RepID=UPI0033FEDADD